MNFRRTPAAHAESAQDLPPALPPVDLAAPAQFETATFALG